VPRETDHQSLVKIAKKPLAKVPARLQSMFLQLKKYNINLTYKIGKDLIIANTLSSAYVNEIEHNQY
jgi:hypothetical protein